MDFDDINVGDVVNLRTNIPRRDPLDNCLVVRKVNNPKGGYVGLFLLQGQSRSEMYIPWNMVTYSELIGHREVL